MDLHPKPKQPIQINRTLIITIAIIVVMVLLLAVISALTTTSHIKTDTSTTSLPKIANDKIIINPELKNLPESYSDIDNIRRFSSDLSSPQVKLLLQQFNKLQNEYTALRKQLSAKSGLAPEKLIDDPKTKAAKEGPLVFSGLGSKVDSLVGPSQSDRSGALQSPDGKEKEVITPTPQQEEFFKKQAQDTQKLATMKGKDNPEEIYDLHNIIKPASKYQIMAGTLIPATLITGIDTTIGGTVIAQINKDLYDTKTGKYLLIPKGSKLLGEYENRIATGQRKVGLTFTRIVRPDTSSILLGKSSGVDALGQAGLEGNVDNHWARIISAATISTILSAGAGIAGDRFGGGQYPSARERIFSGGAGGISRVGENIANRSLDIPPTITLPPGYQFFVTTKRDMIVEPYKTR